MASKKEKTRQRIQQKKRQKRAARICAYLVAAILINWAFCALMADTRSATAENTEQVTITIDGAYFMRRNKPRGGFVNWYWVTADSVRYYFSSSCMRYSRKQTELRSFHDLAEGDTITLICMVGDDPAKKTVVAAYNDDGIYCTTEGYNKSALDSRIATLCVYFFVTGAFSFVLVCSEGFFMQWIRAGSAQRKLEAEQRHKANIAANKADKAKK